MVKKVRLVAWVQRRAALGRDKGAPGVVGCAAGVVAGLGGVGMFRVASCQEDEVNGG